MRFAIHPSIGIARVGNSPREFYLAPESEGGLPTECTPTGDPIVALGGNATVVSKFKDSDGRVKRQAARFSVYAYEEGASIPACELDLRNDVKKVEWAVHLANKKAAWFEFAEHYGDLLLGDANSYENRRVPLRNSTVTGQARQKLIIDPGPRVLRGPLQRADFSRDTIPTGYPFGTFPDEPDQGTRIDTLGEMRTDSACRLLVLGGFGLAGGTAPITSFGGADTWHDDISDGPVRCRLTFPDESIVELSAWVLVGSPKFAPELVNIVTLDDVMFDVGVRYHHLAPEMFERRKWPSTNGWNPEYVASYERDIAPIIRRPRDYQWVATVPTMMAFTAPPFDPRDSSADAEKRRQSYFRYFRDPGNGARDGEQNKLLSPTGIPLMPMNSGSNSVSNDVIDKFLTLTPTQYFLLGQWAAGRFASRDDETALSEMDRHSVANCVGSPMCPGIECTWSVRNPRIYRRAYRILHRDANYYDHGLSPSRDECRGGGCEPGDLTKRMAIPWQADFFQCTVQFINFTDDSVNKSNGIPAPPTYYAYWWPPQSPMFVFTGIMSADEQVLAGVPSGSQVLYSRGVNTFAQMISAWGYLGFIVNSNTADDGRDYPAFAESERNHSAFTTAAVAVGSVDNYVLNTDSFFVPMWYLRPANDTLVLGARSVAAFTAAHHPIRAATLPRTHDGGNR